MKSKNSKDLKELINKDPVYIFGHQNPDTDSICSALAYADLKANQGMYNYIPARLGEINRETNFVLSYFSSLKPQLITNCSNKNVVLVDHNEKSQSALGLETANILEIIDHHRIANLETKAPLYVYMEPLGSTATIIYKRFLSARLLPSKNTAGLLLSALLSDTLILASPTTTDEDRLMAVSLASLAEIEDYKKYGKAMITEGSSLDGYSIPEILAIDRKMFTFGKISAFISQVTTYKAEPVIAKKKDLIEYMDLFLKENNATLSAVIITDLSKNSSTLFVTGEDAKLAHTAFNMQGDTAVLKDIVSRKTQIIPPLTEMAQKLNL